MASDIASVAESGGFLPKAQTIKFSFKSAEEREKENKPAATAIPAVSKAPASDFSEKPRKESLFSKPAVVYSFIAILLIAFFFAGYYLIFPLLNPQ